ncbi:MAG: Nudix family hydrolase [Dechloromonas sp.]|nr:Nudix family hydrolase [Dechloromonas sp.]
MNAIVEVAAAVMLRADGRQFLLAQRPPGKVYAGYWEFPGGKLEAGETVRQALIRELQEELGITVTACSPWLVRQFTYPHATVRLNFWRVTAWTGEIGITAPLEHSAVDWLECGKSPPVAPILPANDPILKALALPTTMAITCASESSPDEQLAHLDERLATGLRLIQVRDKDLPAAERATFAAAVCQRAHRHGAWVVINDDAALAREVSADGVHLSSTALAACRERPDFTWVGASCHTAEEISRAGELALDYALLGPVLPTPSHPDSAGLGWPEFSRRMANQPLPVFALGGLNTAQLTLAQTQGAHGVALMRQW